MDGLPFFFASVVLTVLFWMWLGVFAGAPLTIVSLWVLWFFRDPERLPESDSSSTILSPADGKVIKIEEANYPYLIVGKAMRISVFMNIFNVHVNRIPVTGKIVGLEYHKGKFLGAYADKASLENEQMGIVVQTDKTKLMFIQIAGLIARRIVCRLKDGENVERGQRFGLIRFGSRVDIYMPMDARLLVEVGDTVYAGKSSIGAI